MLGLEENDYISLKYPERELKVAIPVEMDDGVYGYLRVTGCNIPVPDFKPYGIDKVTRMIDEFSKGYCPIRKITEKEFTAVYHFIAIRHY